MLAYGMQPLPTLSVSPYDAGRCQFAFCVFNEKFSCVVSVFNTFELVALTIELIYSFLDCLLRALAVTPFTISNHACCASQTDVHPPRAVLNAV